MEMKNTWRSSTAWQSSTQLIWNFIQKKQNFGLYLTHFWHHVSWGQNKARMMPRGGSVTLLVWNMCTLQATTDHVRHKIYWSSPTGKSSRPLWTLPFMYKYSPLHTQSFFHVNVFTFWPNFLFSYIQYIFIYLRRVNSAGIQIWQSCEYIFSYIYISSQIHLLPY